MSLIGKRWEPDGRDALSPSARMLLSIAVTGVLGLLLEFIGIEVLHAYSNSNPATVYFVTAIWAFGLGPLLVALRRASMFVPMLIVGIVFGFLALYNHYHFIIWEFVGGVFRDTGELSAPRIWEFRDGQLLGIRNPVLIALVAGAMETVVVPASVWTQKLLTLKHRKKSSTKLEDLANLFSSSVVPLNELKPKRDFGFLFMRVIVVAYGGYFIYQIIGLLINGKGLPLIGMFSVNPAETLNTFMKIAVMLALAMIAAFNAGVRKEAAVLLTIGHVISVGASLWLYFAYPPNPDDRQFLLTSVAGDGLLIVILLFLVFKPSANKNDLNKIEDLELRSPAATLLRNFLFGFSTVFAIYTIAIVYFRGFASPESAFGAVFGAPDPLVSNSLTKYGTMAALGFFLYAKPGMRKFFMPAIIFPFTVSVIGTMAYGLQGSTVILTRVGTYVTLPWFMMFHVLVDGGALVILLALRRLHYHVDYQVTSLRPASAECVMALHRSLRAESEDPDISAREVLQRIDEHVAGLRSRRRGLVAFPFWLIEQVFPLLMWFRPPFSTMSRAEQRWMLRRYILRPSYERAQAAIPSLAQLMFQLGDIGHALVSMAYFSSPRGQTGVGYILPEARERLQGDLAKEPPPNKVMPAGLPINLSDPLGKKPLTVLNGAPALLAPRIGIPVTTPKMPDEVDYCIVGSGAAGAILAYRLASAKGRDHTICVLERGGYFSPRQDFSDDELRMIRMLYTEGGLQTTRRFDFNILQGECVGGTTVINNAICIQMPEISRREWANFGIDVAALSQHYERVQQEINIDFIRPESVNQRVEALLKRGVEGYNQNARSGLGPISPAQMLKGNFSNCTGCGLCNIGCRRMRKLSMLETYIPWAQAQGVTVIPNTGAVQCETEALGQKHTVTAVVARKSNGEFHRIRVRKGLIVAAGAIASSRFLMRSGRGGNGVGQQLACNFAVPPLVEFTETLDSFDGVQIPMFAAPENHEAIIETSYNPPGAHSITMPLYFDLHADMMEAYRRCINITALVGSDPAGTVSRKRDFMFGRAVQWDPTANDISRIKKALATIVGIAKAAGATRIFLPTFPVLSLPLVSPNSHTFDDFERLIAERQYFNFVTAHPQGGNMMAGDFVNERVVDLDFRVRDCENLFVCDASIFPRGIRVNPQWTIMALASMAGEKIAAMN